MPPRAASKFIWPRGYWPNTSLVTGVEGILLAGMNVWNRGSGRMVTVKGFGDSVANSGGVNPLLNVSDTYGGLTEGGSITQAFGDGIYFYAGSGEAFVEGVSKGVVAGGSIMIFIDGAAYQAGLLPPGEVTIDLGEKAVYGKARAKGLYSVGITAIRKKTGGESNISPPSDEVFSQKKPILITALGSLPTGADRIGIYGSQAGFGEVGPLFHLYDVDLPLTLPHVIQLPGDSRPGWTDGQLGDLAPTEFFIPPPCTHVFALNAVIVAAGCYGGAGLSPSWPGHPEGFPPRFVMFIPGGGKVTAVKGSGVEGAVLVCTGSSLNLVTAGQTDIPFVGPINIRPIWPTTGVNSANQIAVVGAEIFAWVGTRGPVRDNWSSDADPGDQATAFAEPVMKFFEANGFTAENTVLAYDPDSDSVFYVNGTIGIGYCRYLGQWHTPFTFPVEIVTGVTDIRNGRALFSDDGGNLYQLETGEGTTWSVISQLQSDQFAAYIKTLVGARSMVSKKSRLDIFTDMNIIDPDPDGTNLVADENHGDFLHLNIQDVKSYAVGLSEVAGESDEGGVELSGVEMLEIPHPVRV